MKTCCIPVILALTGCTISAIAFAIPQAHSGQPTVSSVAGVVIRHGKPVPGAEVSILEQDANGIRTVTDSHGRYSIPGPWLASYHLVARKAEWISVPTKIGKTAKIRIDRLVASVSGSVRRDDGTPAAGVRVMISGDYRGAIGISEETRTDRRGRYGFTHENGELDDFSVSVLPDRSGYQEGTLFYLEPGERKLLPPITVRTRDGAVDGVVLDSRGRAVADAIVTPGISYVQTKTDQSGHFRLTGIARGDVTLNVEAPDGSQGEGFTATGRKGVQIKLDPAPQSVAAETGPAPNVGPQIIVGMKAPDLKVSRWVKGAPISITHSKGKVVLLDFWSVTCGPCIRAFPEMERLYGQYRSKGLLVAGICFPDAPDKVLSLIKKGKLTYSNAIDTPSGSDLPVTASRFPFRGTPTLVVIDRQGRIAWSGYDVDGANHWIRRELGLFR